MNDRRSQGRSDYSNHLIGETSPYLLQHAHNPVDWYPWGREALEKAKGEDRPILLSIGYSACHWCHVMAHESFEDPEVAEVMNRLFVNIKVDREERPDLDRIYQTAHQLLTQRPGGWPLTVFLTPDDQAPFFAGTYFPKQARFGLPGFPELLERVAALYHERRDDIRRQNTSVLQALNALATPQGAPGELSDGPLRLARRQLEEHFDPTWGGFGRAPKFPHPTSIERLLRDWAASKAAGEPDRRALHMAVFTLERMARGGVFDQIGGGFCRYSVDDQWMIPHFEKMLYDNGPLLALYAQAHAATGEPLFARTARLTAEWLMREMQSPEGGYYSSLDADSEGEEGRFYLWSRDELRDVLGDEDYAFIAPLWGFDRDPNFEGRYHPHVCVTETALAERLGMIVEAVEQRIESIRLRLFQAREQRVHPGRDDKVLTSWNGLMIRGMAIAGRHLDQPEWVASAERALDFIHETLWRDGRLLATWKDGRAHLDAYLDDHVFLIDGILELLQCRWREGDLAFAIALADLVLEHFEDHDNGGFFFTADDHETLITRPRPITDDSLPSGNGVAAFVLQRLGHLSGESRYLAAAERALQAAAGMLAEQPYACTGTLSALEEYLDPGEFVVLRGEPDAFEAWRRISALPYAPRRFTLAVPAGAAGLPGLLAERRALGEVTAYVCTGTRCETPVTDLAAFERRFRV